MKFWVKMKGFLIKIINFYQKIDKKPSCNYIPTCSEYTKQAVLKYGFLKGSFLGIKRIIRCHPFKKHIEFDPLK